MACWPTGKVCVCPLSSRRRSSSSSSSSINRKQQKFDRRMGVFFALMKSSSPSCQLKRRRRRDRELLRDKKRGDQIFKKCLFRTRINSCSKNKYFSSQLSPFAHFPFHLSPNSISGILDVAFGATLCLLHRRHCQAPGRNILPFIHVNAKCSSSSSPAKTRDSAMTRLAEVVVVVVWDVELPTGDANGANGATT